MIAQIATLKDFGGASLAEHGLPHKYFKLLIDVSGSQQRFQL
jgi:hypothetical protein